MILNATATTDLFKSLFENTNAKEIATELSYMNDAFVKHADVDRLALANGSNLATRLICFFYEAERNLQRMEAPIDKSIFKDDGPF